MALKSIVVRPNRANAFNFDRFRRLGTVAIAVELYKAQELTNAEIKSALIDEFGLSEESIEWFLA